MAEDHEAEALNRHRAESEERIVAASVGAPEILDDTIQLVPYDPTWPSIFEQLAVRIHAALGERVRRLEHVGSTSIPGLSAKPVIDMVLVVDDAADEASYVTPLETVGYRLRIREPEWFQHRVLTPSEVRANLHVFSADTAEVERMVRFRDWLRSHDDDRLLYERTKQELAARRWRYVQEYAEAKGEVVLEILVRAEGAAANV